MIIWKNKLIPFGSYKAMTWWPVIFVRKGETFNEIDERHERIHGAQQKELLLVGFLLLYCIFFLVRLAHYRNWKKAYRNDPFEAEAYFWQYSEDYLSKRKHYAWRKNLKMT